MTENCNLKLMQYNVDIAYYSINKILCTYNVILMFLIIKSDKNFYPQWAALNRYIF